MRARSMLYSSNGYEDDIQALNSNFRGTHLHSLGALSDVCGRAWAASDAHKSTALVFATADVDELHIYVRISTSTYRQSPISWSGPTEVAITSLQRAEHYAVDGHRTGRFGQGMGLQAGLRHCCTPLKHSRAPQLATSRCQPVRLAPRGHVAQRSAARLLT